MKRNHYKLCTTLFATSVLIFLTSTIARADNIYVSFGGNMTIEKFNSSGNGTTFASGLDMPTGLAFGSDGYLYVAQRTKGTIEKFNSNGKATIFASGLYDTYNLAFDSSGNLYADGYNGEHD